MQNERVNVILRLTVRRPGRSRVRPPSGTRDPFVLLPWKLYCYLRIFNMVRSLWREGEFVIYGYCWASSALSVLWSEFTVSTLRLSQLVGAGFCICGRKNNGAQLNFQTLNLIHLHVITWLIYTYIFRVYVLGFCQSRIVTVDYAPLKVARSKRHFIHFKCRMLDRRQV
jgi:hypothetical protein